MPNGAGFAATAAARWSSIAAAVSSIAVVGWGWEAKGRLWRREGGAKERGRAKARGRPNRRKAEAVSWIGEELDQRRDGSAAMVGWVRRL